MSHTPAFRRTDKAIMQAFIDLLKEKSFEKITVQDILDKTPVTRATFYAHYHDKHEIAEKMQEQFFQIRHDVRKELAKSTDVQSVQIIKKYYSMNKELIQPLLKIHSDTINLRQTISDEFEAEYMNTMGKQASRIEARIYAQARTELEIAQLMDGSKVITFQDSNEIYLNVALKLLRLSNDKETKYFLKKKLAEIKPESS